MGRMTAHTDIPESISKSVILGFVAGSIDNRTALNQDGPMFKTVVLALRSDTLGQT